MGEEWLCFCRPALKYRWSDPALLENVVFGRAVRFAPCCVGSLCHERSGRIVDAIANTPERYLAFGFRFGRCHPGADAGWRVHGVGPDAGAGASNVVLLIVLIYAALNVGYLMGLKHVVLLDVFIISAGFMLRLLAGTLGGYCALALVIALWPDADLFLGFRWLPCRAECDAGGRRQSPRSARRLRSGSARQDDRHLRRQYHHQLQSLYGKR